MIILYDLYDMYAVFANIRSHPENPINEKAVSLILDFINGRAAGGEINGLRTAIAEFIAMDSEGVYAFVETQNVYTYIGSILKDEYIYAVLSAACEELLKVIKTQNTAQIADLADCLHNLPIMLAENNYKIPRRFWKNEVTLYRKTWNKDFLKGM